PTRAVRGNKTYRPSAAERGWGARQGHRVPGKSRTASLASLYIEEGPPADCVATELGSTAIARKLVIPVALLGVVAAVGAGAFVWQRHSQAPTNQQEWAVVKKSCFECHSFAAQAGA